MKTFVSNFYPLTSTLVGNFLFDDIVTIYYTNSLSSYLSLYLVYINCKSIGSNVTLD